MVLKRFNSSSTHTLDDRGRIVMPSKYREMLRGELALCYWVDHCIAVLPPDFQEMLEEKIMETVPLNTKQGRYFERVLRANYFDGIEMDRQGRVPIPQALRDLVGLGKEVKLVGMGDHLEIWNLQRWEELHQEGLEKFEENLSALPGITRARLR